MTSKLRSIRDTKVFYKVGKFGRKEPVTVERVEEREFGWRVYHTDSAYFDICKTLLDEEQAWIDEEYVVCACDDTAIDVAIRMQMDAYDNNPVYREAYDYAYGKSNDWMKENPSWTDVIEAYIAGAEKHME